MRFHEPPPPGGEPDRGHPAWMRRPGPQRGDLVVWGAHGGAGTTTLAIWLTPAWDMFSMRPASDQRYLRAIAAGRPLLVVCRNTAWSASRATAAVAAVTGLGGHVAVLAVVSDGWPEPRTAIARFRLLEPQAGALIRVPFVPGLRLADNASGVPLPRAARRALDQIRAATGHSDPIP